MRKSSRQQNLGPCARWNTHLHVRHGALAHIFPLGIMRRKTISTVHTLCDVTLVSHWVSTFQFQTEDHRRVICVDLHKGKHKVLLHIGRQSGDGKMDSKLVPAGGKAGKGQSDMAYTTWTLLGIMAEKAGN